MHLSKFKPLHLSIYQDLRGSIYRVRAILDSLLSISLDTFVSFHLPNTFFSLNTSFPRDFRPKYHLLSSGMIFFTHSIMHFMFFDPTFEIVYKLWGFSKLMEFLWNFWDQLCENVFKSSCIASYLHYNIVSCILDMWLLCWNDCVLIGLDWVEPMMFLLLHITCSCIFMHTYLTLYIFLCIDCDWCFFACISLSFLLSVSCSMEPKRKSTPSWNPLHSGASSSFDPTPSHVRFRDVNPNRTSLRTFLDEAFIQNAKSFYWTFPTLTYPLSFIVGGWESLCDVLVTCPWVLIQEFYSNMHGFDYLVLIFGTRVWGTCIVVTPDIVSDVLRVLKVVHANYLGYDRLKTVSKDKLISSF